MKKKSAKSSAKSVSEIIAGPFTLAIDIGGTGIKALTLDPTGRPINDRTRIKTPKHATPKDVVEIARELAKAQPGYDRVSVGFRRFLGSRGRSINCRFLAIWRSPHRLVGTFLPLPLRSS